MNSHNSDSPVGVAELCGTLSTISARDQATLKDGYIVVIQSGLTESVHVELSDKALEIRVFEKSG